MAEVRVENENPVEERTTADFSEKASAALEKNKKPLMVLGILVLLAIAGLFFFQLYKQNETIKAERELFPAIFYFEQDSLNLALNGDGGTTIGLLGIAEDYNLTEAGNLANFYAGYALLKQGSFQEAIDYLENFDGDDLFVRARSYSLMGDAHMELGNVEQAAGFYEEAGEYSEFGDFAAEYLIKLGMANQQLNKPAKALEAYQTVVDKYSQSPQYNTALKYVGMLSAKQS